jgi:hypothetical protein
MRNNATSSCRTNSAARGLLSQAQVSAVVVVIANVVSKKSPQVAFVESDDVVKQIAAAASHPALGNAVLPRALNGSLHANDVHGPNRRGHVPTVLGVVIKDEELGRGLIGEGFTQLLDDPTAGRMRGDVEVQDATPVWLMMKKQ